MISIRDRSLYIVSLIFLSLYPVIKSVRFMQNDDWVHYRTVERFLGGNFSLEPVIGSTFYTQGLMGYLFAQIFSLGDLPILTLIISILNFYLVNLILTRIYQLEFYKSVVLSLLVFFNPIHFYSAIGFMTDNYFLFFILISLYCGLRFFNNLSGKWFVFFNLGAVLAFFVKQNAMVILISFLVVLAIKRLYKHGLLQLLITALVVGFYYFLFPQTEIMNSQIPVFSNLLLPEKLLSFVFVIGVYISAFTIPMLLGQANLFCRANTRKILMISGIALLIAYLANSLFNVSDFYRKDFPYLDNTFTRKGFYPFGLSGNKYHWKGFYDVFRYWEIFSIIIFVFSLFAIQFKALLRKHLFTIVFLVIYIGSLFVTETLYDRYLLPVISLSIIVFSSFVIKLERKTFLLFTIPYLLFLCMINYQFGMDFIKWENYVWNNSEKIFQENPNATISSSHAWTGYRSQGGESSLYLFTFDRPEVLNYDTYQLQEEYDIWFSGSLHIDPKVFIYRRDTLQ